MSSHHARLLSGLVATSILALSACSMGDFASEADGDSGPTFGSVGSGGMSASAGGAPPPTSGAGGGGGGAVTEDVNIPASPEAQDPYTRFAYLCGDGCTPGGDPTECSSDSGAGTGTGAGLPSAQMLHCQLVLDDGDAIPICRQVGRFDAGGPCHSAADCAAGLGCVAADGQGGVCRQYCCGHVESCAAGTYCDEQPMAESVAGGSAPVPIPVCLPATNCELLNDSVCPTGLTCTIVRDDGTTSCVVPGEGRADDHCPCAPGFVCSMLTNRCKQLCRIDSRAQDCGAGAKCQGGSAIYPAGFGVCVSTS
ncbi:hypothetical protein [Sorangium sp. So ce1000]|uniref:hypothetical protein n=1 Tax=Sorangium sp. So ce1000 TaxID=3133325 RepID=UPI003F5D97A3